MSSLRRLCRFWLLCWGVLAGVLAVSATCAGAQDLQPVPPLSARVVDTVSLLPAASRGAIEAKLAALEQEKGAQVAFLIVATTAPEDIASYANRVGNAWKIGRRGVGDGLLLVVARDDRKVRIEVAKTLEGAIPDLAAKLIIDEAITPAFRRGDYAAGLDAAADRIGALVRGEALPPVNDTRGGRPRMAGMQLEDLAIFLFVAVPVVAAVLRAQFGRKFGSLMAGAGTGLLAWLITASVLATGIAAVIGLIVAFSGISPLRSGMGRRFGRHHHGGWGSGGWGAGGWGGGGGGGGDGGGFSSGGGGDFGGGGASGDW